MKLLITILRFIVSTALFVLYVWAMAGAINTKEYGFIFIGLSVTALGMTLNGLFKDE